MPDLVPVWHPSPNFGARRDGLMPTLIVIHYTAMANAEAALERLCDPRAEVSSHYLISSCGKVFHLVKESQRAWHAGQGEWHGQNDINSRSIGIELDNRGDHPFSNPQMEALCTLLKQIMSRWNIPPEGVIGHSDMAPGRKSDPGPRFDWARLATMGLARGAGVASSATVSPSPADLRAAATGLGYTAPCDEQTLVTALRHRYRPQGRGPLSQADMAAL